MSLPDTASLKALSLAELRDLVGVLVVEVRRLRSDNAALREADEAQQATITALRAENLTTYQLLRHSRVAGRAAVFGAGWRCAAGRG